MFRTMFARYMEEQPPGGSDIPHVDDFVCQECTRWSGLGAIDILAGALDISDDDRRDLRSWYERHAAFYRLVSVSSETLQAVNLINDQPYRIRIDMRRHPFRRGQVIFGSLVPWRGEWYWSGEQRLVGDASKVDADDLKKKMKRQSSAIVCRYSKDYEALVRERMSALHEQMLAFHGGKDLVVYPDGLSMAADWQKEVRWQWESETEAGGGRGRPEARAEGGSPGHQDSARPAGGEGRSRRVPQSRRGQGDHVAFHAPRRRAEEEGRGLDRRTRRIRFVGSSSRPPSARGSSGGCWRNTATSRSRRRSC